jgi:hypothetical protein
LWWLVPHFTVVALQPKEKSLVSLALADRSDSIRLKPHQCFDVNPLYYTVRHSALTKKGLWWLTTPSAFTAPCPPGRFTDLEALVISKVVPTYVDASSGSRRPLL